MFIQPKYKNPEDYKKELNRDLAIQVNTVHDEVNYGVDKFLLKPLLKKLINLGAAKSILDKFGYPYMNFLYDVEYSNTGEFTGENSLGLEDFSPYSIPLTAEEHTAMDKFKEVINSFKVKKKVIKKNISYFKFKKYKLDTLIQKYVDTENSDEVVELYIKRKSQTYKYKEHLSIEVLKLFK